MWGRKQKRKDLEVINPDLKNWEYGGAHLWPQNSGGTGSQIELHASLAQPGYVVTPYLKNKTLRENKVLCLNHSVWFIDRVEARVNYTGSYHVET